MVENKVKDKKEQLIKYVLDTYNNKELININNNLNLIIDKFIEKKQEQY